MAREISGKSLFLRYAWPCAEGRLLAGEIDYDDFVKMEQLVENGIRPEVDLLTRCFPNAIRSLEEFAREKDKEMWSFETVSEFWRFHHGHEGDCAVRVLTVFGIKDNLVATGLASPVNNLYEIPLEIGNSITTHHGMVIEKVDLF